MIAMRVQNWSADQIAAHFDLTRKTVDETMDWAKKEGIMKEFEDQLVTDLLPLAMGAYKKALTGADPNMQAARDVLMGAGILKKQKDSAPVAAQPMDEVEIWMMKRQRRQGVVEANGSNAVEAGRGEQTAIQGATSQSDADVLPPPSGPQSFALNGEDYLSLVGPHAGGNGGEDDEDDEVDE